jgi:hypothetical protein
MATSRSSAALVGGLGKVEIAFKAVKGELPLHAVPKL